KRLPRSSSRHRQVGRRNCSDSSCGGLRSVGCPTRCGPEPDAWGGRGYPLGCCPADGAGSAQCMRTGRSPAAGEKDTEMFDVNEIRKDFPILSRTVYGKPLVYLDSAATSQKPRRVIDCERRMYEELNGNVHRG